MHQMPGFMRFLLVRGIVDVQINVQKYMLSTSCFSIERIDTLEFLASHTRVRTFTAYHKHKGDAEAACYTNIMFDQIDRPKRALVWRFIPITLWSNKQTLYHFSTSWSKRLLLSKRIDEYKNSLVVLIYFSTERMDGLAPLVVISLS